MFPNGRKNIRKNPSMEASATEKKKSSAHSLKEGRREKKGAASAGVLHTNFKSETM